jgi:hypothetical protein
MGSPIMRDADWLTASQQAQLTQRRFSGNELQRLVCARHIGIATDGSWRTPGEDTSRKQTFSRTSAVGTRYGPLSTRCCMSRDL